MMVDDLRAAGREHWQQLLDEAATERRANRQRPVRSTVRPQLARGLLQLAAWLDPAVTPARPTRRSA